MKQPKAKFLHGAGSPAVSAEFEDALDQLRGNRRFVSQHGDAIRKMLDPLLQPPNFKRVPMRFEHVLIFGRSAEKNLGNDRIEIMLEREEETRFRILTYDSVIDAYRNGPRTRKNILRLTGKAFAFKRMESPARMLGFLNPTELKLSQEEIARLRDDGYHVDAWRDEGKLLNGDIDCKTVAKPIAEDVKDMVDEYHARIAKELDARSGK